METRNVTAEVQVKTAERYSSVQREGFHHFSRGGGWLTAIFTAPIGFFWGIIVALAKSALAWVGLGLFLLGGYFSLDNICRSMWQQALVSLIDGFSSRTTFSMLFASIIVTAGIEMAQHHGYQEFKKYQILRRNKSGSPNWALLVLGIAATVLEFASIVIGFWGNGGAGEALSWISLVLAVGGIKIGFAMCKEYMGQRDKAKPA